MKKVIFSKRRKRDSARRSEANAPEHDEATRKRLQSIGETGGYVYSEDERDDVEARLRRMFHGAKVEGSKAQPPPEDEAPTDN